MNLEDFLREGERIDELQRDGLCVIQHPHEYCFGMDAVLLSSFANVKPGETVIELGSGSGVNLLLISARTRAKELVGLEIQERQAERAQRSIALNGLQDRIKILNIDLKTAVGVLGYNTFNVVICNPPYFPVSDSEQNIREPIRIARHEVACNLRDCVEISAKLLRYGGRAYFIHRSERAFELMRLMHENGFEPKRFRLIQPMAGKPPNLALIEGVLGGKPGLMCLPALIVRNKDGSYNDEIKAIYHMPE